MFWVFLFFVAIIAMVGFTFMHRRASTAHEGSDKPITLYVPMLVGNGVLGVIALLSLVFTSVVIPNGSEIALMDRVYLCSSIKDGRNIALPGECGRQSEIIMPGFHFSPFIRVVNNISFKDMIEVTDGHYATLTARDGLKLEDGQVAARPWPIGNNTFVNDSGKEVTGNMLDATFFLTDGMGRKGPQATVLTPGRYPVNTYFWEVDSSGVNRRTTVRPGFVGVINSALDEGAVPPFMLNAGNKVGCGEQAIQEKMMGQLKAVLVPVGCRGVWNVSIKSGKYYLNQKIYHVTEVDTRVQNWTYKGNYSTSKIKLTVDEDGSIHQTSEPVEVSKVEGIAGDVIRIKVEGWTVYQELRIQARVRPDDAPLVVASVGGLQEIEDRIITPQVRSQLRNIGGSHITVTNQVAYDDAVSKLKAMKARIALLKDKDTDIGMTAEQRSQELAELAARTENFVLPDPKKEITRPTRVLDFQDERVAIEKLVVDGVKEIGKQAGIEIVSVALANTDLPPGLLVARKIEQLSGQLQNAYIQRRAAQVQRQATEAAKARADQQAVLVGAKIAQEASKIKVETRKNDGIAERNFLEEQAKGQEAQANVLGKGRVAMLRAFEMLLGAVKEHPELLTGIKLPNTVVLGSGMGLEGPAAILGGTKLFGSSVLQDDQK
jgi:hypothetical protein